MPEYVLHHAQTGPRDAGGLLLIGSLGTTLEMWDPQMGGLADRAVVTRVDIRGHGRSPAPPGPYSIPELGMDVVATLDRLGVERVSVGGLSIGGMIGMWVAAHAPNRVDRLILICTSSHMPDAADAYRRRAEVVRAHGSTEPIADGVLERWFTQAWAQEHRDTVADHRRMLCGIPADGYAGCCEALAALDLRKDLPNIAASTLIIAGTEDRATPAAHAEAIAAAIPQARLELLGGAAHLASVQCPDAVTRLIGEHLTHR